MTRSSVKLEGAKELRRKLLRLEKQATRNKIMRRGLRAGAKEVSAASKKEAPVGEKKNLAKKYKQRAGKRSRTNLAVLSILEFPGFYGAFKHYGTKFMDGDAWIARAVERVKSRVGKVAAGQIRQDLEKEARR